MNDCELDEFFFVILSPLLLSSSTRKSDTFILFASFWDKPWSQVSSLPLPPPPLSAPLPFLSHIGESQLSHSFSAFYFRRFFTGLGNKSPTILVAGYLYSTKLWVLRLVEYDTRCATTEDIVRGGGGEGGRGRGGGGGGGGGGGSSLSCGVSAVRNRGGRGRGGLGARSSMRHATSLQAPLIGLQVRPDFTASY